MISENESWIAERGGQVVEKMAESGIASLNDWERLLHCLWVADYMICNAGDFGNAEDLYSAFQTDAVQFADRLGLEKTREAFSLSEAELEQQYLERFEAICDEIRNAEPKP